MIRRLFRALVGPKIETYRCDTGARWGELRGLGASDRACRGMQVLAEELARTTPVAPAEWFDALSRDVMARMAKLRTGAGGIR